ncbi:hypothetical protein LPUS_05367 [Lasallia pustulata]|uniref:Uncharacterized protein n=1 Tax=Lasallia pustulata TaxID=136370 RepID=A0A1W5CYK2_9LECA|nr:hypothetical protein LPUS_05367 [Lasallia pustulata]
MATGPVYKSRPRQEFLTALRLDISNEHHRALFNLMREEASREYEVMCEDRSILKPKYASAERPFAAAQVSETAFRDAVMRIWTGAGATTRMMYERGRTGGGDNWIIAWMLYSIFRARDPRNKRGTSSHPENDDHADEGPEEGTSTEASKTPVTGQGPHGYYDPARDGYRKV